MSDQGSLHGIEQELENLPDGMDEAYALMLDWKKQKEIRSC